MKKKKEKKINKSGVWLLPTAEMLKQDNCCKPELSLSYTVSPTPARATLWNLFSKQTNNNSKY